jgi:hypothetical protein
MARPLVMPQPSSAVARLLEPGIGRAALAEPGRDAPQGHPVPTPTGETPDIKREFILTGSADATLREAVSILSRATGTDVTNSHFLRSLLKVLAAALPEIEREAARTGRLKRPGNARGREAERESYKRRLAEALLAGMAAVGNRAAPPPVEPGAVGAGASPASGGPVPSGVR